MTAQAVEIGAGVLCLIGGFILVIRGVGAERSKGAFKFFGVEMELESVGPGAIFAALGVILIVVGANGIPLANRLTGGPRSQAPESSASGGASSAAPAASSAPPPSAPPPSNEAAVQSSAPESGAVPYTPPAPQLGVHSEPQSGRAPQGRP